MDGRLPGWRSVSARPSRGGKPEYRLMARWTMLLVTRAALIAGNESGAAASPTGPTMSPCHLWFSVISETISHLLGWRAHCPSVCNGWSVPAAPSHTIYVSSRRRRRRAFALHQSSASSKGFSTVTPVGAKSRTLRVTTVKLRCRAMAAICRSELV